MSNSTGQSSEIAARVAETMRRLAASAAVCGTDGAWLDLAPMRRAGQFGGMVVKSAGMIELMRRLARLSAHRTTVLIRGESGTGKELVARAVWELRREPRGPFVTFNCSNLVETLAESQLFGHVRGAFTDAREDAQGFFRAAEGGVLFLDEVGELPMSLQAKLLRAVEHHEVQPVGSTRTCRVGVQIVAATNRDLKQEVETGRFRADLFYRLNVAAVAVPPLRDRIEAIDALVSLFVERCNREFSSGVRFISRRAMERLLAYRWPGNVRELEHAIRCALLLSDSDRIDIENLPREVAAETSLHRDLDAISTAVPSSPQPSNAGPARASEPVRPTPASLRELTREALVGALSHARGNRQRAARILGVSRTTLYRMLVRYGLEGFGRDDRGDRPPAAHPMPLRLVKA
ncbi:MAG TPA: sigma-54 dependent transcriptional regulator [Candidatus Binataceae bacterium]|nr:sigma-54 dependent transcriptional regulator [Candidatus Binataceae bacterium]